MVTKKELRITAKSIRTSLNIEDISEKIVENILTIDAYKKAKNVLLFYPLEYEINLIKLLEDKNKNFYLPKMEGEQLAICPYLIGDELTTSKFKTKEPLTVKIKDTKVLDVIFVPALMVDKTFNRLGYGGGFYDRLLAKQSHKTNRITPIASALVIDEIPADNFDERIDVIVCEKVINRRPRFV
jgi:5-formyltetrahydrofolate cyclo-ligase